MKKALRAHDDGPPWTWEVYVVDSHGNPGGTVVVDADNEEEAVRLAGEQFGLSPGEIGKKSRARKKDTE
jgi:hypothetical protein